MSTDRLAADRRKLLEAVGLFRTTAKLHPNSSDEKLIAWAHGRGAEKSGADIVRDAWHDFEQGRALANLATERFVIPREASAGGGPQEDRRHPAPRVSGGTKPPAERKAAKPSPASARPEDEEILY